ncbi:metallophosphoesterase [Paenibacillus silvae]|uniref:metallophosphoesterase n=1 Tax=Paenibacillus silvae TaxID=1325358 RepID=UPI0025A0AC3C|nr:metallophosphoesterase [Paenibacillus silvae]
MGHQRSASVKHLPATTVVMLFTIFIVISAAALLLHMWLQARAYDLIQDDVELINLPAAFDGATILYVSDTHKRLLRTTDFEKWKGKADWVLIGGDIAEEGVPWSIVRHNMNLLSRIAPAFAVYGNHDKKAGTAHLKRILDDSNVLLLQDRAVYLQKGSDQLRLIGLDYRSKQSKELLRNQGHDECTIVLIHDPLEALRLEVHADLVLSGHTHGGQLVLPWFGPIFLNRAYRKVSSGWFSLKRHKLDSRNGKMLVSKGFGTNHLPLRLGCPAEVHLITLHSPAVKSPDQ